MFATREGQTEKVALRIAAVLRDGGADVSLVDAKTAAGISLSGFDLLVFGASMHAGGLERELVGFVNAHAEEISQCPRSFFLVLLSAAAKDQSLRARWLADAQAKMNEQLEVPFDDVEMIAGALRYSKYPLPLRWLMQRISRQAGGDTDTSRDYEYTDWGRVDDYARRLQIT
jgi:menaquinone-dependent protoporphyrinogen oxidase